MSAKTKTSDVTIEYNENGPFIVKGLKTLRDARNQPVEMKKDVIALCRCGGSNNKPFCDGTHNKNGFSGKREISKPLDRDREYAGKSITILDNRTICSHAAYCVDELKSVFKKDGKPWIDPDGATTAAIIKQVKKCPSGALSYKLNDEVVKDYGRAPAIHIVAKGPYNVVGNIEIKSEIQPPAPEHYALCRCGASKNKPFCDGSHYDVDFDK